MRRPPSLSDSGKYPVTTTLAVCAIAVTVAAWSRPSALGWLTVDTRAFETQPWRLLTSALPHVNLMHVAFNVYWLWVFGTLVERRIGAVRYVGLFVLSAVTASALDWAFASGGIGLSGVGYGLFAFVAVLQRTDPSLTGAVDRRTTQLFVGWFFFCIVTTVLGIFVVANTAHAAGAAAGALAACGLAYRGVRRWLAVAGIGALLATGAVGSTWARPFVNFSRDRGSDAVRLAYDAYQAHDFARAVHYGRIAVRTNPHHAVWWYNLGLAETEARDDAAAIQALRRSLALEPSARDARAALANVYVRRGIADQNAGRDEASLRGFRDAIAVQQTDDAYFDLGISLQRLGRAPEAEDAYRHALALAPTEIHRTTLAALLRRRSYDATMAGRHDESLRALREALELDPSAASGWFNLGIEYEHTRQWRDAATAFRRARDLAPSDTRFRDAADDLDRFTASGGPSISESTTQPPHSP
jgi:GlpG protein